MGASDGPPRSFSKRKLRYGREKGEWTLGKQRQQMYAPKWWKGGQ